MQIMLRESDSSLPVAAEPANKRRFGEKLFAFKFVGQIEATLAKPFRGSATRRVLGFSMIELMVALAVTVILTVIAIPSFNRLILSNKLTTTANDMVAAINSARIEAIKRNAATQFCGSTAASNGTDVLGKACTTQAGAVFLQLNGTSPATATTVLAPVSGLTGSIQISGTGSVALRFNGSGLATNAIDTSKLFGSTVADICTSSMSANNHVKIAMTAGSILQTTTSSGTCP